MAIAAPRTGGADRRVYFGSTVSVKPTDSPSVIVTGDSFVTTRGPEPVST